MDGALDFAQSMLGTAYSENCSRALIVVFVRGLAALLDGVVDVAGGCHGHFATGHFLSCYGRRNAVFDSDGKP
jgi:hypothetical protein